jgi:hypothetical protein
MAVLSSRSFLLLIVLFAASIVVGNAQMVGAPPVNRPAMCGWYNNTVGTASGTWKLLNVNTSGLYVDGIITNSGNDSVSLRTFYDFENNATSAVYLYYDGIDKVRIYGSCKTLSYSSAGNQSRIHQISVYYDNVTVVAGQLVAQASLNNTGYIQDLYSGESWTLSFGVQPLNLTAAGLGTGSFKAYSVVPCPSCSNGTFAFTIGACANATCPDCSNCATYLGTTTPYDLVFNLTQARYDPLWCQNCTNHALWFDHWFAFAFIPNTWGTYTISPSTKTARITGRVAQCLTDDCLTLDNTALLDFDFTFTGFHAFPNATIQSPKLELNSSAYELTGPVNSSVQLSWRYFSGVYGTLIGVAGTNLSGLYITASKFGPDWQWGTGANGKNLQLGAAVSAGFTVESQPTGINTTIPTNQTDDYFDFDFTLIPLRSSCIPTSTLQHCCSFIFP